MPDPRLDEIRLQERTRTALIIKRRAGDDARLRHALEQDEWIVKTCTGLSTGDCPVMRGQDCPLRQSADAAIVFMDPKEGSGSPGFIPRLRCAADSSSPGIVALIGRLDGLRYSGTTATVGAVRGPGAIISALDVLLPCPEGADEPKN